jgi:zinc/manganese transport system substrate-binding protein
MIRNLLFGFTLLLPALPAAALQVFACEADWGALVQELAGDRVEIYTATTGAQDVHHIQARPSLLARARNADLLVCTGAELEAGWLPLLLRKSGNPRIQEGAEGHFMAAEQVVLKERPTQLDRAQGDIHAAGNPHIQTDPHNIARVAKALALRLQRLDPANAGHYQARAADFDGRWQAAIVEWERRAAPLRGMPIVVHHRGWVYLEAWLGLRELAALEPKPGVPPSGGYLAELVERLQAEPPRAILHAGYQEARPAEWLSGRIGAPVVSLPAGVGGSEGSRDLFGLFDEILDKLLAATR